MPLLSRSDVDNSKIVELISYDTSLTGSVLRICNSAFYSRGTAIDNLPQAVSRLGSREIYRIAVAVTGAVTLTANQTGYGVEAADLWRHSVTAAVAAQLVAKEVNEDEDVIFTAGILHDVGKIVLSAAAESRAQKFKQVTDGGRSLVDAEEMIFGCNHAEVGARLLQRWNLPERLIAAVRFHHAPAAAGKHVRLAACVDLGNSIAYFMGYGYGQHALSLSGRDEIFKILNLSSERLPQYMEECFNRLKQVKSLYNLRG
jgi:putative nucleotidyltransferase with HDIG domain